MKRQLLLIPIILAATTAFADAPDAQAQAAALFSRPQAAQADTHTLSPSTTSPALDAQASAAALLSGTRATNRLNTAVAVAESTDARVSTDAQAQAAALLGGSRSSTVQTKISDGQRTIGRAAGK